MYEKSGPRLASQPLKFTVALALILLALLSFAPTKSTSQTKPFHLSEATIEDIHNAYSSGRLTSHQLVQLYLNRIDAYDKKGAGLNAIITINPKALEEADLLDAAFKASGFVGPLHGIPIILKDQMDAKGMPTTLGSILFKNYYPDRDAFVAEKLRKAGAIILAQGTLGGLGGGGTFGSLFGPTPKPFAPEPTSGRARCGPGAGLSAKLSPTAERAERHFST